jgi:hypothetical protein
MGCVEKTIVGEKQKRTKRSNDRTLLEHVN